MPSGSSNYKARSNGSGQSFVRQISLPNIMKFAVVGVLLAAAFVGTAVEGSDPCADAVTNKASGNYKNPESGEGLLGPWHCMTYYQCAYNAVTGKVTATKKDCWILLPLRQFNPVTSECEWFWKVNCKANNPSPTPSPTTLAPTTPAPTTPAPTTPAPTTTTK